MLRPQSLVCWAGIGKPTNIAFGSVAQWKALENGNQFKDSKWGLIQNETHGYTYIHQYFDIGLMPCFIF